MKEYNELYDILISEISPVNVSGANGAHLLNFLLKNIKQNLLVVTPNEITSQELYDNLTSLHKSPLHDKTSQKATLDKSNILHFPHSELVFINVNAIGKDITSARLKVLDTIIFNQCTNSSDTKEDNAQAYCVVTSVNALLAALPCPSDYKSYYIELNVAEDIDVEQLIEQLVKLGYMREDMVESRGQFSMRGGILDIYPHYADNAFRIELFDTEIDTIRTFNVDTQRTLERCSCCVITPADEILPGYSDKIIDKLKKVTSRNEELRASVQNDIQNLSNGIKSISRFLPLLYEEEMYSLIDYMRDFYTVLYKPDEILECFEASERELELNILNMIDAGFYIPDAKRYFISYHDALPKLLQRMLIGVNNSGDGGYLPRKEVDMSHSSIAAVYKQTPTQSKPAKRIAKKNKIDSFTDLTIGDYVVHQNHGIGEYTGISTMVVDGIKRDYIQILYRGNDALYVPVEQLDHVYKYIGREGASLRLNKLGGTDWSRTKQRVKQSCTDMAAELARLYAAREQSTGVVFVDDNEFIRQFDNSFLYDETDDQLRSINEVKADMLVARPMDRLLCGDVGYGKTEVAIRAAFRAVLSGYQVAYLAPTTILVNQHFINFKRRMQDFAVSVEMLSRFRTPTEQKNILKKLKNGELDIIIGTHRLIQKDVSFKKLGLLIIDEEQRFGVKHKETIKELKNEVDVLTLTATPIPRTLHMSMIGIRDMSILEEPPKDRYPVSTYVLEYDERVVRDAILKETGRGGQVFYLYNRIDSIHSCAKRIAELVPHARIVTAHGRMNETELENIMIDLLDGKIDILVCTTIIETGLDIPNVNTIIIEDADRMGLSQLYQLRGRVGRSNRLAFAYLTYRKDKELSEVAGKRLRAIKDFTEFGSGFKIAMRDLEIRGAGNLMGAEQHGHMESVGYDMYCKLLEEAVNEIRGIKNEKPAETLVDIGINAFIPDSFISAHLLRIQMYKRIAAIETEEDLSDIYDELTDRFGDVPAETCNLLEIALIKNTASSKKITEVSYRRGEIVCSFDPMNPPDIQKIVDLKIAVNFKAKQPHFRYPITRGCDTEYITDIKKFLELV